MKVIVFRTNRRYAGGRRQTIAAVVCVDRKVEFHDSDRYIDGVTDKPMPSLMSADKPQDVQDWVMGEYDNCRYTETRTKPYLQDAVGFALAGSFESVIVEV
jgi:hypothetical protein